ncbi:MAG TPA: hypothetical protein VIU10_01690 [Candidatus Udaeobacter sp.]
MAILIVCAGFTVGGMTFLEEYFYHTRPRVPDPMMHRVYPEDVKSIRSVARVYLTRVERIPFDVMQYWSPVLVIAGIATAWILVLQKRRRDAGISR